MRCHGYGLHGAWTTVRASNDLAEKRTVLRRVREKRRRALTVVRSRGMDRVLPEAHTGGRRTRAPTTSEGADGRAVRWPKTPQVRSRSAGRSARRHRRDGLVHGPAWPCRGFNRAACHRRIDRAREQLLPPALRRQRRERLFRKGSHVVLGSLTPHTLSTASKKQLLSTTGQVLPRVMLPAGGAAVKGRSRRRGGSNCAQTIDSQGVRTAPYRVRAPSPSSRRVGSSVATP